MKNESVKLGGWTLSETLVTIIVAGIVFLAVMDGMVLLDRYARIKTGQIAGNMRTWEGYSLLWQMAAAADSVSADNGSVGMFRHSELVATLFEADSSLVMSRGSRRDTLIVEMSGLRLAGAENPFGADTITLTIYSRLGEPVALSFPVRRAASDPMTTETEEEEKRYAYE